jgi:CRP/FNR family transcriptional regulator, cyclic AMP receptor protein
MAEFEILKNEDCTRDFGTGATIFKEGDIGTDMFVVLKGNIDITLQGIKVNQITVGDIFGEMALVRDAVRKATAVAQTDCKLAIVDRPRFEALIQHHPGFAIQVMAVMADRLDKTTQNSIQDKIKRVDSKVLDKLFLCDD